MPARINIHHRIVAAIRIEVVAIQVAVGAEVGNIVGGDKAADRGVIVPRLQPIKLQGVIVVISAIAEGILPRIRNVEINAVGYICILYRGIPPCIIRIREKLRTVVHINGYNIPFVNAIVPKTLLLLH